MDQITRTHIMPKKILNVITQSDENYLIPGSVMVTSLCENNQHFDELNVFYLSLGIPNDKITALKRLEKKYKNLSLHIIDSQKYQNEAEQLKLSPWNGKLITWFKLLVLSDVPINTDRVLYLNPHSIVTGALDGLVSIDFGKNVMLNIYDYFENFPGLVEISERKANDPYFNCGLMLINFKVWEREKLGEKVRKSLRQKSNYKVADQDFCNSFFKGRIASVPFEYYVWETLYTYNTRWALKTQGLFNKSNYYSFAEVSAGLLTPKIIYLTSVGAGRAWFEGNYAPTASLFDKYLSLTAFENVQRPKTIHNMAYYVTRYSPRGIALLLNFVYSYTRVNILWKLGKK